METFRIKRAGNVDVVFDGELLASETSKDSTGQQRWTEVRIYRTDTGKYVSETIGCSAVPGETPRINVQIATDPLDLHEKLKRRASSTGELYLTDLAIDALTEAGRHDPAIQATLVERI